MQLAVHLGDRAVNKCAAFLAFKLVSKDGRCRLNSRVDRNCFNFFYRMGLSLSDFRFSRASATGNHGFDVSFRFFRHDLCVFFRLSHHVGGFFFCVAAFALILVQELLGLLTQHLRFVKLGTDRSRTLVEHRSDILVRLLPDNTTNKHGE